MAKVLRIENSLAPAFAGRVEMLNNRITRTSAEYRNANAILPILNAVAIELRSEPVWFRAFDIWKQILSRCQINSTRNDDRCDLDRRRCTARTSPIGHGICGRWTSGAGSLETRGTAF